VDGHDAIRCRQGGVECRMVVQAKVAPIPE